MKKNIAIILAALLLCTACQSHTENSGAGVTESGGTAATVEAGGSDTSVSEIAPESAPEAAPTAEAARTEEVSAPEEPAPETTAATTQSAPEEAPENSAADFFFKPGLWKCTDYYYYEFYAERLGGCTMDFDCGIGQPFGYDVTDADSGELMFHIFAAEDMTPATAKVISENEIELTWDFGRTDTLVYVPDKTMEDIEAEMRQFFKPGTWRGESQYIFFDEDGSSGSTRSFDIGIGLGFRYEIMSRSQGFVNMHMGAADNSEGVVVADKTEDSFTLIWEDGSSEKFVYVSPQNADEFKFYTNEELEQIALRYYQANNSYTPGSTGSRSNADGTVTIQLYDNLTDHNSTSAWYTIDRVTLKGTDDIMDTEVDMSAFAD